MARNTESSCKLCRREGMKMFLKGDRCNTDKCAFDRREYAPGQHGQRRTKVSEYGTQLREKQKIKRIYGLLEKQFRRFFALAEKGKGVTGENLIQLLEARLDNMVYRLGFAHSRAEARILITHRHFAVNGKVVTIPSYLTRAGDVVTIREKSQKVVRIQSALQALERRGIPEWLAVDDKNFKGTIKMLPVRAQITLPMNEQLVVELYSK